MKKRGADESSIDGIHVLLWRRENEKEQVLEEGKINCVIFIIIISLLE